MEKFNISKPKKYIDKNGVEKTYWNNIGTYTEFTKNDGSISRIIEIPAIGLEANIFPITPRNEVVVEAEEIKPAQGRVPTSIEYPEEEIDPEDIPF